MYENERKTIELLRRKVRDLEAKCRIENRQPLPIEQELMDTMRQEADRIERELPQAPQSMPSNFTIMNRGGSSGSSYGSNAGDAFDSAGGFFKAVVEAGRPGGRVDDRLFAASTGLGESVPSEGGFLLQPTLSSDIYQTAFEVGKLAKLCRRIQVGPNANGIKIPGLDETSRVAGSRHGGVRAYWIAEAGEKTASKPKFRIVELSLHKLVVLIYATDELIEDANALEGFIRKVAADELAFSLDNAILNGTGAGQILGILNSGSLVEVAKETGQSASTLVTENILKMWSRMIGSARSNAYWLINQDVESQLYSLSLSVGTGGIPVFMPAGQVSSQPYATLFGRPIVPVEQCPTLGQVGDIILANFSDGYVLAEKGGVQSDVSIHVQFIYDESVNAADDYQLKKAA